MNIKRLSSKVVALALSFLMVASAVYVGFEGLIEAKADSLKEIAESLKIETEYIVSTEAYYEDESNGGVPSLNTEQWEFNALSYSDISDPQNPKVKETFGMYRYAQNVGGGGFTNQDLRYEHWGESDKLIPYYNIIGSGNRNITFGLVDATHNSAFYNYGSQVVLKFDAETGGKVYDFQGNLYVTDNTEATGTIYYRAVKIDASGVKTTIWPTSGWSKYVVTSADYNPDFDLLPFEVACASGEKLAIEVYADLTTGQNIKVNLGNIALNTIYDREVNDVEKTTTYNIVDYDVQLSYGRYTGSFKGNDGRFRWGVFTTHESMSGLIVPLSAARTDWTMYYATVKDKNGTTHTPAIHTVYNLRCETKRGTGPAYQFVVPYSGTVYMGIHAQDTKVSGYFRVLLNGTKVYPEDSDWGKYSAGPTMNEAAIYAEEGDIITFQAYSDDNTGAFDIRNTYFTVVSNKHKNLPTDSSFGAAFDVPYAGKAYDGAYTVPSHKYWKFANYDISANEATYTDEYRASKGNYLYSKAYENLGFKFNGNDLTAIVAPTTSATPKAGTAAEIDFVLPSDGRYDMALGGDITKGGGKLNYRVLMDGEAIYPNDGSWAKAATSDDIVPIEITGTKGATAQIQYAVTESSSATAEINLGTVSIFKGGADVPASRGFYRHYPSYNYEPLAVSGFDGTITKQASRYEFSSTAGVLNKYTEATRILTNADGSVTLNFANPNLEATIGDGKTLTISATSPEAGTVRVNLTPSGAGVQYRILKGSEEVVGWTAADGTELVKDIEDVEKSEKVIFEFKVAGGGTAILGLPAISFEGAHLDNNDPSADLFYALNSNPYYNIDYTGEYNQKPGIWNYNTIEVSKADGSIIGTPATNKYEYNKPEAKQGFLSNAENGAGYIFDITNSRFSYKFTTDSDSYNGMSLKFIAPKDTADQEYDMSVVADLTKVNGDIYYRVTLDGENIWPTDKKWNKQTASGSGVLNFPLLEFEANQGQEICLDIYSTSDATMNLNSPYIKVTSKTSYLTADVVASMYSLKNYNPFQTTAYSGTVSLPSDSRWNLEVFEVTYGDTDIIGPTKMVDNYNSGSNYLFSHSTDLSTGIRVIPGTNTLAEIYADGTKSNGISYRFVSPIEGKVTLVGAPSIQAGFYLNYDTELYFRIIKTTDTGVETVWPTDGEWAVGDKTTGGVTGFRNVTTDVKIGTEISYQVYCKSNKITEKTVLYAGSLGDPAVLIVDSISDSKTKFNVNNDWTPYFQISPYWSYLAATDPANPNWFELASYDESWGNMYLISNGVSGGIMRNGTRSNRDNDYWKLSGKHHAYATQLRVPKTGYITIKSASITSSLLPGLARITLTRDGVTTNLWPEGDGNWTEVNMAKVAQPELMLEIQEGDLIRFESTIASDFDTGSSAYAGKSLYISWPNALEWSKVNPETLGDKNIYGTLEENMLQHFKDLAQQMGKNQFDQDYEANKYLSENPPVEDYEEELPEDDFGDDYENYEPEEPVADNEPEADDNDENDAPKHKKKVYKYIYYTGGLPIWAIVLICVGAAVLVAGITILIIILVKKKKKNEEEVAAAAATAEGEASAEGETTPEEPTEE